MAQCIKCGNKATVAVTRAMSIFPTSKRFYCDDCKAKLDHKEDIILVLILTVTFLVVVGVIVFHYLSSVMIDDSVDVVLNKTPITISSPASLQNVLTPAAWATYQRYGYPFDRVNTENTLSSNITYTMTLETFETLFARQPIRNIINFPDLMTTFIQRIKDPGSGAKLRLVFLTDAGEIGFTVQFGADDNPTYVALIEQLGPTEQGLLTGPPHVDVQRDKTILPAELPEPTPETSPEADQPE